MPAPRNASAIASAERRTSAGGNPSAEMLGIRESAISVSLKPSKCWSAYLRAVLRSPFGSAIGKLLREKTNRQSISRARLRSERGHQRRQGPGGAAEELRP